MEYSILNTNNILLDCFLNAKQNNIYYKLFIFVANFKSLSTFCFQFDVCLCKIIKEKQMSGNAFLCWKNYWQR